MTDTEQCMQSMLRVAALRDSKAIIDDGVKQYEILRREHEICTAYEQAYYQRFHKWPRIKCHMGRYSVTNGVVGKSELEITAEIRRLLAEAELARDIAERESALGIDKPTRR